MGFAYLCNGLSYANEPPKVRRERESGAKLGSRMRTVAEDSPPQVCVSSACCWLPAGTPAHLCTACPPSSCLPPLPSPSSVPHCQFIAMSLALPLVAFLLMLNHVRFLHPYGCERRVGKRRRSRGQARRGRSQWPGMAAWVALSLTARPWRYATALAGCCLTCRCPLRPPLQTPSRSASSPRQSSRFQVWAWAGRRDGGAP